MGKTSDILYGCVLNGTRIDHPAVIVDFFGKNVGDDHFNIIYGLYEDLVKNKGVTKEILYECFIGNQLDELIHTKYTMHPIRYYKELYDKQLVIGATYYDLSSDDENDELPNTPEIDL